MSKRKYETKSGEVSSASKKPRTTQKYGYGNNRLSLKSARLSIPKGVEMKALHAAQPSTVLGTSGTISDFSSLVLQGTSSSTRTGDRIIMKSLQIRGALTTAANNGQQGRYRIIVIMDKQPNNATFNPTDYLATDDIDSVRIQTGMQRFITLKEINGVMPIPITYWNNASSQANSYPTYCPFQIYVPKLDLPVAYKGTDGTNDVVTNGIYILLYSNLASVVSYSSTAKIIFNDP